MKNSDILEEFFGAYFHQDWDIVGNDWKDVTCHFISESDAQRVQMVITQLEKLADDLSADKTKATKMLTDLGNFYYYQADDYSAKHWVAEIAIVLKSEAKLQSNPIQF